MNNKAVFAGTFDHFTLGHYEIVKRASEQFSTLYVAVSESGKNCKFSLKKRVRIAQLSLQSIPNVVVIPFKGFLVDFMKENGITVYVRGLRNSMDFEYERNLYLAYKSQDEKIEGVFYMSSPQNVHISSTLVREILAFDGDVSKYVVADAIPEIK